MFFLILGHFTQKNPYLGQRPRWGLRSILGCSIAAFIKKIMKYPKKVECTKKFLNFHCIYAWVTKGLFLVDQFSVSKKKLFKVSKKYCRNFFILYYRSSTKSQAKGQFTYTYVYTTLLHTSPGWMSQNHLPHSLKHAYWRKNTWFGPFLGFGHWGPSYRPISIWPWAAVDRAALAHFMQKKIFD